MKGLFPLLFPVFADHLPADPTPGFPIWLLLGLLAICIGLAIRIFFRRR